MFKLNAHTQTIRSFNDEQNQAILRSIAAHGLCPGGAPLGEPALHATYQSAKTDNAICVNYMNLTGASHQEQKLAIKVAVHEEYCGVYGIATERSFPFQKKTDSVLFQKELSERVMSCMVFILPPPKLSPRNGKIFGSRQTTHIAFYQLPDGSQNDDGFSQSRGGSLLADEDLSYTNRVTEIKTSKSFSKKEILVILVPKELVPLAQELFPHTQIIPVENKAITIKLPQMLDILLNEKIHTPVKVNAPNFEGALLALPQKEYSIHAVRLHTTFDHTVRPVVGVEHNQAFLSKAKAKIAMVEADGSGFVFLSKKYATSKTAVISRMNKMPGVSPGATQSLEKEDAIYKKFVSLRPLGAKISQAYKLNNAQVRYMHQLGVHIYAHQHYHVLSYPERLQAQVADIVSQPKKISFMFAAKIQAAYRGFFARSTITDYRNKVLAHQEACEALDAAKDKMMNL